MCHVNTTLCYFTDTPSVALVAPSPPLSPGSGWGEGGPDPDARAEHAVSQ